MTEENTAATLDGVFGGLVCSRVIFPKCHSSFKIRESARVAKGAARSIFITHLLKPPESRFN